jgi:hypothetical protein
MAEQNDTLYVVSEEEIDWCDVRRMKWPSGRNTAVITLPLVTLSPMFNSTMREYCDALCCWKFI